MKICRHLPRTPLTSFVQPRLVAWYSCHDTFSWKIGEGEWKLVKPGWERNNGLKAEEGKQAYKAPNHDENTSERTEEVERKQYMTKT